MTAPTLDANNPLIGTANTVGLLVAPVGTALPATPLDAWPAGWETVGYIHEDGITLSVETDSEELFAWQSKTPLRSVITGKSLSMEFSMLEVTPKATALFFDEDVPSGDSSSFSLTVTSGGQAKEYAVAIDTRDGDKVLTYVFPRATLSENGDIEIKSAEFQGFPVTLKALDDNGTLAIISRGTEAP